MNKIFVNAHYGRDSWPGTYQKPIRDFCLACRMIDSDGTIVVSTGNYKLDGKHYYVENIQIDNNVGDITFNGPGHVTCTKSFTIGIDYAGYNLIPPSRKLYA